MQEIPESRTKLIELEALYTLERVHDVLVEGTIDHLFYQNYLDQKKIRGKIVPVEQINLEGIEIKYTKGLDLRSKKDQVIALSRYFQSLGKQLTVRCVIDKDFDDYIDADSNDYLWRTDYCCLESYLYCPYTVGKILKMGIGNFPKDTEHVLDEFGKVLKFLFSIRLWRELYSRSAQLMELSNSISIDKKSGTITLDEAGYLNKFLMKNNLHKDKIEIINQHKQIYGSLKTDVRLSMQGHDYVNVFFLYINKVKNTQNFKIETFEKAFYLSCECVQLESHHLFKKLEKFFMNS